MLTPSLNFWRRLGVLGRQGDFPLDRVSGAARAYSLRKLKSGYAGSAIKVRRSSDDAELDIGFTIAGELDTLALSTFVGANSAFIVTLYDQSGNGRNYTQATAALQPRIVNAGTLDTENGKPTLRFTTAPLYLSSAYTYAQPFTYSIVAARDAAIGGSYQSLMGGLDFSSTIGTQATTGFISMYAGSDLVSSTVFPAVLASLSAVYNGASSGIRKDGTSVVSGDAGAQGVTTSNHLNGWGGGGAGSETGAYAVPEFIHFAGALSTANQQIMEASQKAYYGTP